MSTIITSKRAELIRRGAVLANEVKRLQEQLGLIKDALETLDAGTYSVELDDGINAEVRITEGSRTVLDSKIVKGFLTPAQLIEASKTSDFRSFTFSTRVVAIAEAA